MAKLGVRITCYTNGTTLLALSLQASADPGGFRADCSFRIIRRRTGYADKIMAGVMDFSAWDINMQPYSWTFIDENVPDAGDWDYVVQIRKNGSVDAQFDEMQLSAVHFKR